MRSSASASCPSTLTNSCSSARNISLKLLISMAAALPFDEVRQNLKARAEQEYGARMARLFRVLPWRLLNGIRKRSVPGIFVSGRVSRGREAQTSLRRTDALSFGGETA